MSERIGAQANTAAAVSLHVNGHPYAVRVRGDESAVELLRDRLRLTGTKHVCGEGVCGACTVRLDGVPVASCLLPAASLDGRTLTTVEGLGPALHPVQRAFVAHDALQCGYCTPGFVVSAVAFYERWRAERGTDAPSNDDVTQALAGHLCRCGAYPGIVAAVREACAGRFDAGPDPDGPRVDSPLKVTGRAVYTTDVRHDGQLEGAILRSPHPHALVRSVDFSAARAAPGVRAAVDLLPADRIVRYVGHEIAAVAAVDRHTALAALALVGVDYEPRPFVVGMDAARAEGAPRVYEEERPNVPNANEGPLAPARWHGNVRGPVGALSRRPRTARRLIARARAGGDPLLVEGLWRADGQIHTALEPHAAVARWDGDELLVHVSTQAAVEVSRAIAARFGLAVRQVRVVAPHVGGGFGAKLQLSPETVAAIALAREAAAPVRVALDRLEETTVGGYRPGAEIRLALLARRSGLHALQLHAYQDAGVACGSQIALLARMIYPAPAKELLDYDVVSHLPPGTPFRGPGAPLTAWALEQAVDEAAHRLGDDPIALRTRWDPDPGRRRLYRWAEALELWRARPATASERGRFRRGVGVAAGNWLYLYQTDCAVEVGVERGRLYVATAVQDMGTGIRSVLAGTLARAFDLEPGDVDVRIGDTRLPPGPTSGGSRTTATLVPALLDAAAALGRRLARETASRRGWSRARAEAAGIRHTEGFIPWTDALGAAPDMRLAAGRPRDRRGSSRAARAMAGTGLVGLAASWMSKRIMKLGIGRGYTGAVHVIEVEVDTRLGRTRVRRVAGGVAAGRPAVPALARSQCHGGVIQGIGYALYEQRVADARAGVVLTAGLEDYRIPGPADLPEITMHFDEEGFEHVPGGGVGLGEVSTLAVAAAVGNAVHNATGWRPYELPIRPDRLLDGVGS